MATTRKLVESFIGAAKANPGARPEIFRRAAYTLMGLAQNPKNARSASQLARIGNEFARAAWATQPVVIDDFDEILQETAQAYEEVGDDPMDLVARRREIHDERTPPTPGQVSIAPESFNRDATLGRSQVIKYAPTEEEKSQQGILQSQTVAFWQGTKKEAQAISIDISLGFLPSVTDPDLIGNADARPYAEVEFGSDGNRTKFKCDINHGTRLTVVGNYCAVTVGMDAPMEGKDSAILTVGASIGTFAAPSQAPVICTLYVDGLEQNVSTDPLPIPLKAVQLLPIPTGLTLGGTYSIEFLSYAGVLVGQEYFQQAYAGPRPTIPVPADAAYIRLNNGGPSAFGVQFRLPFQLGV